MNGTKIQFSKQEWEMMTDPGWILTKNSLLDKVHRFFGELHLIQQKILEKNDHRLPPEIRNQPGKISRGEKYQGLPWLMLDHPRYFAGKDVLAIRTMFWWGNFFSTTLHLSGRFKLEFEKVVFSSLPLLSSHHFLVGISENQWHHNFNTQNYWPAGQLSAEQTRELNEKPFLKLAKKIPIGQPEETAILLTGDFEMLVSLLVH